MTLQDKTTEQENILWSPSNEQIEQANSTRFITYINSVLDVGLSDYQSLYQWSVDQPEAFWNALWQFANIIGEKGTQVLENKEQMPGAVWFSDSTLNFAENLLNSESRKNNDTNQSAIIFWGEDQQKTNVSFIELNQQVSSLSQYLREKGIQAGDVVAGIMPNMPEAVIAMLATASIGAVWTSCSPDFGVQGVLDRFGQVKPKLLITANAYYYNGKTHDCLDKVKAITSDLDSIENIIVVPYASADTLGNDIDNTINYPEILANYSPTEIEYTRMPFNAPLYIMYSSGTTGVPKCIVHGIGGTLLQHLKEHILHANVTAEDKVFYFTTCGWMMWNWLVSTLATGATLMLYDGSPFYPDANILFDYAEQEAITVFGTSAKYIDVLRKEDIDFKKTHSLENLKSILSTGSVLVPESYDYVYENIKQDLCLSSISGGTDIVSCFVLGSPVLAVRRGELQSKGLGMDVQVWDDDGKPIVGQKGELVCAQPFPSMPIYFWNDPDNKKYHDAYFEKYKNIWCHGDYVTETENGGLIFYGRSDTVLNPGGVRIGTAEIYRQVEKLDEVQESIVIGQNWEDDVRVVLFVKLSDDLTLDEALIKKIKLQIRNNTTPRHVPAKVLQVNDIPRTKSGKIVEIAVRCCVHNEQIKNSESLANPEALDEFRGRAELLR